MENLEKICVTGIGRLGICTAVCLSSAGYDVMGIDMNKEIVKKVNDKKAPFLEPQVKEYLQKYPIRATTNYEEIKDRDVSLIIVPTPSTPGGPFDYSIVEKALESLCQNLDKNKYHVFDLVSTVSPGTCSKLVDLIKDKRGNNNFGFVYNPEFIAQGSIIRDFFNPDFVLVGENDKKAGNIIEGIYKKACKNEPVINRMNLWNAELTKIALNSYTTMKMNFANLLAEICEKIPGGDVDAVTNAIGTDTRIGKKYLKGATSYGGPCFPRDNKAFDVFAGSIGVDAKSARATDEMNNHQVARVAEKIINILGGQVKNKKISILGVSYKPGTPITEESASLKIKDYLGNIGANVTMYDEFNRKDGNLYDVLENSELAVIALPCDEFKNMDLSGMKVPRVLDCWRIRRDLEHDNRVEYYAIGLFKK